MNTDSLQTILVVFGCAWRCAAAEIPTELRFDDMSYRTAGLYQKGGDFFHVEYFPSGQASTNAATSVEFFRQQLSTESLDQLIELQLKALKEWKPRATLTVLEKSERHMLIKDVRFDGTLSGRAFFILYLYEVEGRTLLTSQFILRPRPPFDSAEAFSNEFTTKETKWLKDLRQLSLPFTGPYVSRLSRIQQRTAVSPLGFVRLSSYSQFLRNGVASAGL